MIQFLCDESEIYKKFRDNYLQNEIFHCIHFFLFCFEMHVSKIQSSD